MPELAIECARNAKFKRMRKFKPFMHSVEIWPNTLLKSYGVHTAKFLKYVWPFFNIAHEMVKSYIDEREKFCVIELSPLLNVIAQNPV